MPVSCCIGLSVVAALLGLDGLAGTPESQQGVMSCQGCSVDDSLKRTMNAFKISKGAWQLNRAMLLNLHCAHD